MTDHAADAAITSELQHYLQQGRDSLVASLDGLSDYDIRRPMTASGTNLLGLLKHVTGVELGYLGSCVGRPAPFTLPWYDDGSVWEGADMWARAHETREELVELYSRTWRHSDESFASLPLATRAVVPWWPEERGATTFGHLAVRVVAETAQHAGHADIIRENIDGRGGSAQDIIGDRAYWSGYVSQLQAIAKQFREE